MYFGQSIKLARESRGLSQTKLANSLNINQATLSRFEKGQMIITESIVKTLSEVLDYPVTFFEKDFKNLGETTLFYRKRASMTIKDLSILESKISILSNSIDELIESVEIPILDIPAIEPCKQNTPEDIAYKIRNYFNMPQGPVENIVSLIESKGVIVFFINADNMDKFDGLTLFTNNQVPVIWINNIMPNDRKRFSLAHELGHLVMHLRSNDISKSENDKENEANAFASEFLMPRIPCKQDFFNLKYKDLGLQKMYWKVSKAAIIFRAEKLCCISHETAKYLYITLGRNGERKKEEIDVDIDSPQIVKKMINLHINDLLYSMEDLSDILSINQKEIRTTLLGEQPEFKLKAKIIPLRL